MYDSHDTRASLLSGLRDSSDESRFEYSWERFNERYTPRMYRWARRMGLSQADAEEVCQDLMLKLLKRLKTLTYNPDLTFRGWLRAVTRNAVIDFIEARKRMHPMEDTALQALVDRHPLEQELNRLFDEELLATACESAEARLRRTETGTRNWEIFVRLQAPDSVPDAIADEFRIRRHAVYVAKNRVMEVLRDEVNA
ncbi:MAG: sigma-70 family RNA polymerase sigma factor [Planctomycetaceae bacterium]